MVNNATIGHNEAVVQYEDSMKNYGKNTQEIVENNREKPGPEPKI